MKMECPMLGLKVKEAEMEHTGIQMHPDRTMLQTPGWQRTSAEKRCS